MLPQTTEPAQSSLQLETPLQTPSQCGMGKSQAQPQPFACEARSSLTPTDTTPVAHLQSMTQPAPTLPAVNPMETNPAQLWCHCIRCILEPSLHMFLWQLQGTAAHRAELSPHVEEQGDEMYMPSVRVAVLMHEGLHVLMSREPLVSAKKSGTGSYFTPSSTMQRSWCAGQYNPPS